MSGPSNSSGKPEQMDLTVPEQQSPAKPLTKAQAKAAEKAAEKEAKKRKAEQEKQEKAAKKAKKDTGRKSPVPGQLEKAAAKESKSDAAASGGEEEAPVEKKRQPKKAVAGYGELMALATAAGLCPSCYMCVQEIWHAETIDEALWSFRETIDELWAHDHIFAGLKIRCYACLFPEVRSERPSGVVPVPAAWTT